MAGALVKSCGLLVFVPCRAKQGWFCHGYDELRITQGDRKSTFARASEQLVGNPKPRKEWLLRFVYQGLLRMGRTKSGGELRAPILTLTQLAATSPPAVGISCGKTLHEHTYTAVKELMSDFHSRVGGSSRASYRQRWSLSATTDLSPLRHYIASHKRFWGHRRMWRRQATRSLDRHRLTRIIVGA